MLVCMVLILLQASMFVTDITFLCLKTKKNRKHKLKVCFA